jgi:hypothetical protein
MESKTIACDSLLVKIENYGKTSIELLKLKSVYKFSSIASSIVNKLIIGGIGVLAFLCLTIGLGFWVGELLGKVYLGFFVMAGVYLFICLLLFLAQRQLKNRIKDRIIIQLLNH